VAKRKRGREQSNNNEEKQKVFEPSVIPMKMGCPTGDGVWYQIRDRVEERRENKRL